MLLPAVLQDWLPAGHLAYFIHDTVDALDLKAFYARYEGGGHATSRSTGDGGRYKREFGVPEGKAQENFEPAYNAQTAVDEAAHIIVAAELDNAAPDANGLLPMIQAIEDNLGELPGPALADAGYRSCGKSVRRTDWSLPRGGRLEGAVEHAGAPSWRGLGGAVRKAAG